MSAIFEACPDCHEQGIPNALYWDGSILACPVHGEVTDSRRMAEYRQHGSLFLQGKVPTQKLPVSSNGGIS